MEGSAASSSPNSDDNYHGCRCPGSAPCNVHLRDILTVVVITVALTLPAILLTNLLLRRIQDPPDFLVDSFSLSNFTFTNGSRRLFMDSEVRLTALNPNVEYSLSYENIVASIYYKYELLFQRGLPHFSHEAENKTSLVVKFAGDVNVDKWMVDEIDGEIGRRGSVGFDFLFISRIAWGNYSSGTDTYRVLCRDLVVGIPSDGSPGRLTGKPEICDLCGRKECDFVAFH